MSAELERPLSSTEVVQAVLELLYRVAPDADASTVLCSIHSVIAFALYKKAVKSGISPALAWERLEQYIEDYAKALKRTLTGVIEHE